MSYKRYPPTEDEIEEWETNKGVNPRTKRKIKINGPTYKILECAYNKLNINSEIIQIDNNDNIPIQQQTSIKNSIEEQSDSDVDDCTSDENYKTFRLCKVDPIMYEKVDERWAFKFKYKWNPYSGERTDECDENGPLYFDPEYLINFWYKSRMNNLWKEDSDENDGYYHGYYGDAVGSGPDFNIKGRGKHYEWYLFRLPILDCYLDKEHNHQYITMGPILTNEEIKLIDNLIEKKGYFHYVR